MTLKEAKAKVRLVGMTLSKRDGEYRVNFKGGQESTAYYTDGEGALEDAVRTAYAMAGKFPEDEIEKRVGRLSEADAKNLVRGFVATLYGSGSCAATSSKDWSPDTLDTLASMLASYRLAPRR